MSKYLMALIGFLTIAIGNIQVISQRSSVLKLIENDWPADAEFSGYSPILAELLNCWHALIVFGIILIGMALTEMLATCMLGKNLEKRVPTRCSICYQKPIFILIIGLTITCLSMSGKSAASFAANQIWSSILKVSPNGQADPLISKRLVEIQNPWDLPIWFGVALLGIGGIYCFYTFALNRVRCGLEIKG